MRKFILCIQNLSAGFLKIPYPDLKRIDTNYMKVVREVSAGSVVSELGSQRGKYTGILSVAIMPKK